MGYTLTVTDLTHETGAVAVSETQQVFTINYNAVDVAPQAFPVGGTTGQVLKKASNADYDTEWVADEDNLANNDTDDLTEGSTNLYFTAARADARVNLQTGANLDLSSKSTSDLTEGATNLYYTDARWDTKLAAADTDDLTEGATNLYYTDARARASISVSDTGGDGSLSYDANTGVLTYTGPSASEVRAHFSAGTGVTLSSGEISIGQAVATTSDVTFNDVTVNGDLTVSGTTTTVNTETINLADNQIVLNSNYSGSTPTENAGIEVNRGGGTAPNKTLVWDETADKWTVGGETFVAGTFEGALTGAVTGTVSSLSNHDTDDLTEGAVNLYYTNTRVNTAFDTRLASKTTDNLTEGSANLYYTTARFDTAFSGKSTTDLTEGANLYYTDERVDDRVSNLLVAGANVSLTYDDVANTLTIAATEDNLSNNTTDDLTEGSTNLYYTDARWDTKLAAADTDDLTEGSTNLYYTDARARSSISLTTSSSDLSYNSSTGEFSYTSPATVSATNSVLLEVRNTTGATIAKGVPVYISGHSGNKILVAPADADDAGKMPAVGLMNAALANNSDGEVISFGLITGINTSAFSAGAILYISTTPGGTSFGGLTTTKPTSESAAIQNIGKVARSDSNGEIIVSGPGRSNDVPNLNDGKIFVGNASNQSITATLDTSLVPENTNLYYTDARADARIGAANIDDLNDVVITSASTGQVLKYNGANWVNDTDAGGIALTDLSVGTEAAASGDGAISYDNSTGVFTYTPPTATGIGALANVVEDTSPQLGADLDAQGFGITDGGRSSFNNPSTSSASTAALSVDANGHGAPAFVNTTGYVQILGNALLGRSFNGAFTDMRAALHLSAALQSNYSIQTGAFTIDTLDASVHVVNLSGAVTVTFATTTINRSNIYGALGDSGHIMQYEFYANQDATGGHALSFVKSGGGATVYEYGTQDTSSNARQHCLVRCFHANSGGFNAIHVHWG
jgi:hypothetical protein